jgi:aminopeptidase 2
MHFSMGLIQDATVLAKSGYAKTSTMLDFISQLGSETEDLVWTEMASGLSGLVSVWWEQPQAVRDAINAFRRDLFGPLAQQIGFDSTEEEDAERRELRVTVLSAAAAAEHEP